MPWRRVADGSGSSPGSCAAPSPSSSTCSGAPLRARPSATPHSPLPLTRTPSLFQSSAAGFAESRKDVAMGKIASLARSSLWPQRSLREPFSLCGRRLSSGLKSAWRGRAA
eukprot:246746-Lingulodinium_polyedra.AAC.1